MIELKKETKTALKLIIFCIFCCAILVGSGYFYLERSFEPVKNSAESIPYEFSAPENKGIMLNVEGNKTFFYLDFKKEKLKIIIPPNEDFETEILGYPIDFHINSDYDFLAKTIDFCDGIELESDDGVYRHTGVQAVSILEETENYEEEKRRIITAILKKIGEFGIDDGYFRYIVVNTETDILVPDCHLWQMHIKELCENGEIIN